MGKLHLAIVRAGKAVRLASALLAAAAVLWGIAYRFVFGFTPPWLDAISLAAAGIGVLVLLSLARAPAKPE